MDPAGPMLFVERYLRLLDLQTNAELLQFCHRVFVLLLNEPAIFLATKPSLLGASIVTTAVDLCQNKNVANKLKLNYLGKDFVKNQTKGQLNNKIMMETAKKIGCTSLSQLEAKCVLIVQIVDREIFMGGLYKV